MLDTFEIVTDPIKARRWAGGGIFQPAEVRINGHPLIELIRVAEEPWTSAEYLERLPEFENPAEFIFEPGAYMHLGAHQFLLPSRNWLDQPEEPGFILDENDPRRHKTTVLGCSCGITECWFVQVRIEVEPDVVRWSDFGQFHRPDWIYALGPFMFDRHAYEAQLARELAF